MKFNMKKFISLLAAFAMLISMTAVPAMAAENVVYTYDTYPGAVESKIQMKVNGEDIFVEDYKDISYAKFAFEGVCEVEITPDYTVTEFDISPHSFNIEGQLSRNTLKFTLDQSRKIIVEFNGDKKLFIFADDPEVDPPEPGDEGVYNLMDYEGIDNTGNTVITDKIQAALDDVSYNHPGGTLYIPNGKYLTGMIRIRSNTTVYLESGAIIQGTANAEDYPQPTVLSDGNEALISALICFDTAENSKLTGRGTIDGDGKNLRQVLNENWLISIAYSKNCVLEDLVLRDPSAFGVHIMYSDDVTVQRTKQIHDLTNPNTDGIDPDCSRNILIDNVFSYCSDDSVSVKSNRYSTLVRNVENITISNNVFWTLKSALKIGDETMAHTEKNIKFINNDVVRADRAVVLYIADGSKVSDVQWINNRTEYVGGDTFERIIDIWIHTRPESMDNPGQIENLLIKDLYAEQFSNNNSMLEGFDSEHQVKNVYIDNFVVGGKKVNSLSEARIDTNEYVENVVFEPAPEFVDTTPVYEFSPDKYYMNHDGYVTIEAENYNNIADAPNAKWTVIDEAEKRGVVNDYGLRADVSAAGSDDVSQMGRTDYNVKFLDAGTYYVWVRLYAKDVNSDFITVGIDGVPTAETGKILPQINNRGWYWSDSKATGGYARVVVDKPGIHTINVWTGTDGVYLDRIVLYSNAPGDTVQKYNSPGKKGMGMPPTPYTDEVSVRIDGNMQEYDTKPVILNDRVLLPFRAIGERLGALIEWDGNERKVTAKKSGTTVEMTVGNAEAYKNGEAVMLDSEPVIIEDRVLVPVRFVGESLNAQVSWDGDAKLVDVATNEAGDGDRIEVENMFLDGFLVEANPYMDNSVVASTDYVGHAKFTYTGESGTKSMKVYCYAPAGTKSYFKLYAGDTIAASGTVYGQGTAEPLVLSANGVDVQSGDDIIIESVIASGEAPKFDYLKIYKGNLAGEGGEQGGDLTEGPVETVYAKIEAESMELNGYEPEANQFASGSQVVKTGYIGTAKYIFDGEDGTYTLKLAYFDENDGSAEYRVLLNGKEIDDFASDADLGNASPITETLDTRYVVTDLAKGDEITVEGTMDGGEAARFDYMEILVGEVEKEKEDAGNSGGPITTGRIELEKTTLSGLTAEAISGASGGSVVRTEFQGTASFKFEGESKEYTINVCYYDENDGAASYKLMIGGTVVDEWIADEDKGNASPVSETKVTHTVKAKINKGDEIVLECKMDAGEPARADYIEIK